MKYKLIISIVTWNNQYEIDRLIESLQQQKELPQGCGIVISDNASSDDTCKMIKEGHQDTVLLVENDTNMGFGKAHNQIMHNIDAEYYLLLNPDCYFEDSLAISKMLKYADENPEAWIIGPKILNPDNSLQYSARSFPDPRATLYRNTFLGRLFPDNQYVRDYLRTDINHNEITPVDWLSGAAMLIRKELVDITGGFDERYFMYVEDMDLCKECAQLDRSVMYFPDSVVIHRIGASSDSAPKKMIYAHHRSMLLYFVKYASPLQKIFLTPFAALALAVRRTLMIWKL